MNIDINVNTEISKELEEIHLQVSIAQDKMRKQIIYLKDKATREEMYCNELYEEYLTLKEKS